MDAILFQAELPSFVKATVGSRLALCPFSNCGVLSAFNYQHYSVIRPRLDNFDFKQLLDTELFCG